jgi:integrase/recombinase XerC
LAIIIGVKILLIIGTAPLDTISDAYKSWLQKQPLSASTRRTYLTQVRQFCVYLHSISGDYGNPLTDPHARDYAVRDYKTHLKTVRKRKPNTINIALAAIDHFYSFLNMDAAQVKREEPPNLAPKALAPDQQKGIRGGFWGILVMLRSS